ncbi:hypothetical protein D4R75_06295 [bacterium]|nr:MAG: hypothetical protein D4R75_06295 [bacterium]
MNHDQYRELLHLSLYRELNDEQGQELSQHLTTCSSCSEEFAQLRKLDAILHQGKQLEITDAMLDEARRELRVAIRMERTKRRRWLGLIEGFNIPWSPGYRVALAGVATLLVGISVGYVAFAPSDGPGVAGIIPAVGTGEVERSQTRVSGFRFMQPVSDNGDVEFTFDIVTPVRMKGNVSENSVQRVLAQALVSEQNPGARLRTVSALANQAESTMNLDVEIKQALLQTLKSDANVGVRKEALKALQKFPIDKDLKEALLYVLSHESNPTMRIDVINHLEKPMLSRELAGQDILDVLKERMQSDNNNYIRHRAQNIYEEVQQQ